ncbi:hypothetical protein NQ318_014314 [Aromia moschata]|uniref:Uncharacterized protein n=1 Tax=Aromia moschata TaxID=1265417 RepID=A0AAV8Z1G4_9CUCU|nr:hypothetical protein NQ318_014314 [Aromia moschata]
MRRSIRLHRQQVAIRIARRLKKKVYYGVLDSQENFVRDNILRTDSGLNESKTPSMLHQPSQSNQQHSSQNQQASSQNHQSHQLDKSPPVERPYLGQTSLLPATSTSAIKSEPGYEYSCIQNQPSYPYQQIFSFPGETPGITRWPTIISIT